MREIRREEDRAELKLRKPKLGWKEFSARLQTVIRIHRILFVKGNPAQNQTTSEPVNALIRAGMKVGAFGRKIKRPFPISKPVCA